MIDRKALRIAVNERWYASSRLVDSDPMRTRYPNLNTHSMTLFVGSRHRRWPVPRLRARGTRRGSRRSAEPPASTPRLSSTVGAVLGNLLPFVERPTLLLHRRAIVVCEHGGNVVQANSDDGIGIVGEHLHCGLD